MKHDIFEHSIPPELLRTEGDVNVSPQRRRWAETHLGEDTMRLLARDEQVFLRQSLSTPCLNIAQRAQGIYLTDVEGRQIIDFHGNGATSWVTVTRASWKR